VKKQEGSKEGGKKPNILQKLGFTRRQDVAATPPPVAKPPSRVKLPHNAPVAFDEPSINARYGAFQDICADAEEFPQCREKLLDALIGHPALFGRYICNPQNLKTLIIMRPQQRAQLLEMIMTKPQCRSRFMHDEENLYNFAEEFPDYRDTIVNYAFEHREVYSEFLFGFFGVQAALKYFPGHTKEIFEIILNDQVVFEKCLCTNLRNFLEIAETHPDYTDRFIEYIFISPQVYRHVIHIDGLYPFLEKYPQYLDRMMDFILSSDVRFEKEFSTFEHIDKFAHKYPQYGQRMYEKALSIPQYVRREIHGADRILDVHKLNPAIAGKILTMVLADDQWILKSIMLTKDLEDVYKSDFLRGIGDRYMELIYQNPEKFISLMDNKGGLERIIEVVPKDQEANLRHYYNLYVLHAPEAQQQKPHTPPKSQNFG
jgi:hypothetical protein